MKLDYEVLEEEEHRGEQMKKVDGEDIQDGPTWVFAEDLE